MTTPVASPSMSLPDAGAAAAKPAAASPETGDSFGAVLAQVEEPTEPAAADTDPNAQTNATAVPDAAVLATAMANQAPYMAQIEAPNVPVESEDAAPVPDAENPAADPAKHLPSMALQDGASPPHTNPNTAPAPDKSVAAAAPQSASAANQTQSAEPEPAPVQSSVPDLKQTSKELTADQSEPATTGTATVLDDSTEATPPTQTAEAESNPPKSEKPPHKDDDIASAPPDGMDLTAVPAQVAAQFLSTPASPTAQPAFLRDSQPNPQPQASEESVGAAVSAAAQAIAPRAAPADKTADTKTPGASGARNASESRPANARDPRTAADAPAAADAAPAPASDAPNRTAANNPAPAEHGAKNEPIAAAPNFAQANPAISTVPNHGGTDLPAGAVSNTAAATPPDADVPVKLAFTAPGAADTPAFDALALKIAARSLNGENNFSLRLDPPELGRIEVNLNVRSDGHAHAELSADKAQTLELLQRDSSSLERALKDAGLNLAGGLTFSLKGEGKSQSWRDAQSGRGRNMQIGATDSVNANAAIAAGAALAGRGYGLPTARLDIRV